MGEVLGWVRLGRFGVLRVMYVCVCACMRACVCTYPALPPTPTLPCLGVSSNYVFLEIICVLDQVKIIVVEA